MRLCNAEFCTAKLADKTLKLFDEMELLLLVSCPMAASGGG